AVSTERDLRVAIVECGRIAYERGLISANNGNISARLGDDQVVITPSGLCKGRLSEEDLVIIDLDGNVVKSSPRRKLKISSETPMHLEVYRQRPDVRGVVHAHPTHAVALTIADIPFPMDVVPEVLEALGEVPTTRFALPSSEDNALAIRELIGTHDALLLRNHGALTVGRDLDEALINLERIEAVAHTFYVARALGQVNRLPEAFMPQLAELYRRMKG
ncbi:MAG: class II aldolase/adducin family protein, partial [Anaerolineales bacterium]